MTIRKIARYFERGNVCVTGLRGKGKDVLVGNVIARRKKQYTSNLDYGSRYARYTPLKLEWLSCGGNTYKDFSLQRVKPYSFPLGYGVDVYLSDCGVYFPSQYNGELNRDYGGIPTYMALSRQVSRNNVHFNVQNLNRVWDKIREQSDTYIRCTFCKVILGFVIQRVVIYDKAQSCIDRVNPCRIKVPLFANGERRLQAQIYRDNFYNTHGEVKAYWLIYRNRSAHDTYYFEKILKGDTNEKT